MRAIIIDVDNHRHNGGLVPVGTRIEVDDQAATWLVDKNKAHYEVAPTTTETTKKG